MPKTLDEYRKMVEEQLNPLYQSKAQNVQSSLDSQLVNYDNQAGQANRMYDKQVQDVNTSNAYDYNNFSNNVLSRNMARGSIAVSGLEQKKEQGQKRVDNVNFSRTADLGNIENQKTALRNSIQSQLQALDTEKLAQIIGGANNLYNADVQKEYEAQQTALKHQWDMEEAQRQRDFQAAQDAANYQRQLEVARQKSASSSVQDYTQQSPAQQRKLIEQQAWSEFASALNGGIDSAENWVNQNKNDILNSLGESAFNEFMNTIYQKRQQQQQANYAAFKSRQADRM